jgi:pimeloyl-ACP methyl ester carboxylesterase
MSKDVVDGIIDHLGESNDIARRLGLKPYQLIVLSTMALLSCLILGISALLLLQDTRATQSPPTLLATPTSSGRTASEPTQSLPPTWTPSPTATPIARNRPRTFAPDRCPFEIPEGARVDCGLVVLPERRGDSPEGLVRLAVSVYRTYNQDPAPPLIYLSGGPGAPAVEGMIEGYDGFIAPLLDERDVIIFDQRGTGLSEPALTCPEYINAIRADLKKPLSEEEAADAYADAFARCSERLTHRGIDLAAYTSAANATDVKELIELLGYDQAVLYGASYGTRLGLTILRDHPEIVHSVVLDAVEPIEVNVYHQQAAVTDRLLNKLFDGCRTDPTCNRAHPDLEAKYYELVARLNEEPVEIWTKSLGNEMHRVQLDGTWLTTAVFFSAYSSEMIRYIPRMVDDTYQGDYDLLTWMLGAAVGTKTDMSLGMTLSINCHEETFGTTVDALAAEFSQYPHIEGFAHQSVFGGPENLFAICQDWGAAPFVPREAEPVTSDVPALVMVGTYDPITPPAYAEQVAAQLSNVYFYQFPGHGHGVGLGQSPCAVNIMRAFLDDPTVAPDTSCLAQVNGPDFVE